MHIKDIHHIAHIGERLDPTHTLWTYTAGTPPLQYMHVCTKHNIGTLLYLQILWYTNSYTPNYEVSADQVSQEITGGETTEMCHAIDMFYVWNIFTS